MENKKKISVTKKLNLKLSKETFVKASKVVDKSSNVIN